MSERYIHEGWVGEEYKSDFRAKWGLIAFDEMLDCTHLSSHGDAACHARSLGFKYAIMPIASATGNRLYKINKESKRCIYAMLGYLERNAEKCTQKYRNNLDERITQLVRMARVRSKNKNMCCDLEIADILRRVKNGKCEATGIEFNLTDVHSPLAPSIDQIEPGGGYTQDNVMVVAMIYNSMKQDYTSEQVCHFVEHLQSLPSPKTWLTRSR
jgi:hypothetical protein